MPLEILTPPGADLVPIWQWLAATWFGAGLVVPLRAGLAVFAVLPLLLIAVALPRYIVPVLALIIFIIGIQVSTNLELATGVKDDRRIVIDEVAAFLLGASLIRQAGWKLLVPFAAVFLFLDRLKPWPMALLEEVPSGIGVMLDDVVPAIMVAGMFAAIAFFMNRKRK